MTNNSEKSLAWSPDGNRLATNGQDNTARLLDARTGKELLILRGHTGNVTSVCWSPDGKRLASASSDGTIQVYAIDIHELGALARRRVAVYPSVEGCRTYLRTETCPVVPSL